LGEPCHAIAITSTFSFTANTLPPRSRISLISKSDIKYVGTLHEINSETSTIALENVTSYGTEGRAGNPSQEQPGSDQIYEYIVFRGSDVKELSMVEAPKENQPPAMPNDPAIMGVRVLPHFVVRKSMIGGGDEAWADTLRLRYWRRSCVGEARLSCSSESCAREINEGVEWEQNNY
jgi:small nuclear ribonucleoprotein (snRNP)-like protein